MPLELIRKFDFPDSKRTSLLDTSMADVPFQLLPKVVYRPEQLEKRLKWEYRHSRTLSLKPTISVCVSGDIELKAFQTLCESLAVQSYREFELFVPAANDRRDEVCALFEAYKLNGACFGIPADTSPGQLLQALLAEIKGEAVLVTPRGVIFHPQALFVCAKVVSRKPSDFYYFNNTAIGQDAEVEFIRRAPVDRFSVFRKEPFGALVGLSSTFAKELAVDERLKLGGKGALSIHAGLDAIVRGRSICRTALAVYSTTKGDLRSDEVDERDALLRYARAAGLRIEDIIIQKDETYRPVPVQARGVVQVVIPFCNKANLTTLCLESLKRQTCASDLQVTLVNNGSEPKERTRVEECVEGLSGFLSLSIVDDDGLFNFARINNSVIRRGDSPFILFLNNDVELKDEKAISELRNWCAQDGVGLVGGALFYEDGSLQHGGISFSPMRPTNVTTSAEYCLSFRETNAVSLAMAMAKRQSFDSVGGLLEEVCPNGFGDALFGHRLREKGLRILFAPFARGIHRESASRGRVPEEVELWELFEAGVPVPELYADFGAQFQPMAIDLGSGEERKNNAFLCKYPFSRYISQLVRAALRRVKR